MQSLTRIIRTRLALLIVGLLTLFAVAVAVVVVDSGPEEAPAPPELSSDLREAVTIEGVMGHTRRLQAIADEHGGSRAAGTPGYDASADYVANMLHRAGYRVTVQRFDLPTSAVTRNVELRETNATGAREYALTSNLAPMERTAGGEVQAPLRPVDAGPTSGCGMDDFDGFPEDSVALLRRGTCTFGTKARNAEEAGASAVLIFNAGEPAGEVLLGALDEPRVGIPVLGTSGSVGRGLLARDGSSGVHIFVDDEVATSTTNIIAQTRGGNADETVILGAHLDSVPQGPGINDNGSGSATVLEVALQMAELEARPRNKVRFAFWGAEELGLLGSTHYVEDLEDDDVGNIAAYLNFDMVGSPNFIRSVYEGPDEVKGVFGSYFESRGIEVQASSALDGRSDHGPFQDEGVPTGGLFSGAGGTKTEDQQEAFGGEAGIPFDACYHRRCDSVENLNQRALDQFSDGAAHATAVLAQR